MRFLICILLLFPSVTFAINFEQKDGRILLYGDSCEEVFKMADAIRAWQSNYSQKPAKRENCHFTKLVVKWGFHVDVTDILPKWLKDNYDKYPKHSGPNCWNSALYATKFLPYLRYTPPDEVSFYLNSKLCRPRKTKETLSPGDFIAIRKWDEKNKSIEEVHGFIHIENGLAFSKNGRTNKQSYALFNTDDVLKAYGVKDDECKRLYGPPSVYVEGAKQKDCKAYAQYFTCSSLGDYLQDFEYSEDLAQRLKSVDEYECLISKEAISGVALSKAISGLVDSVMKATYDLNTKDLKNPNISEKERFAILSMQFRITGIFQQNELNKE